MLRIRSYLIRPQLSWGVRRRHERGVRNLYGRCPMTKCPFFAVSLLTLATTSLNGQASTWRHRWRTLVNAPDVRIELDTANVQPLDHQRRVWLRWTFPTPVPDLADAQLERRDVDCARAQTRVLTTQESLSARYPVPPGTTALPFSAGSLGRAVSDSAGAWVRPSRGSLEHQALEAVCRWAEAGA